MADVSQKSPIWEDIIVYIMFLVVVSIMVCIMIAVLFGLKYIGIPVPYTAGILLVIGFFVMMR